MQNTVLAPFNSGQKFNDSDSLAKHGTETSVNMTMVVMRVNCVKTRDSGSINKIHSASFVLLGRVCIWLLTQYNNVSIHITVRCTVTVDTV